LTAIQDDARFGIAFEIVQGEVSRRFEGQAFAEYRHPFSHEPRAA